MSDENFSEFQENVEKAAEEIQDNAESIALEVKEGLENSSISEEIGDRVDEVKAEIEAQAENAAEEIGDRVDEVKTEIEAQAENAAEEIGERFDKVKTEVETQAENAADAVESVIDSEKLPDAFSKSESSVGSGSSIPAYEPKPRAATPSAPDIQSETADRVPLNSTNGAPEKKSDLKWLWIVLAVLLLMFLCICGFFTAIFVLGS